MKGWRTGIKRHYSSPPGLQPTLRDSNLLLNIQHSQDAWQLPPALSEPHTQSFGNHQPDNPHATDLTISTAILLTNFMVPFVNVLSSFPAENDYRLIWGSAENNKPSMCFKFPTNSWTDGSLHLPAPGETLWAGDGKGQEKGENKISSYLSDWMSRWVGKTGFRVRHSQSSGRMKRLFHKPVLQNGRTDRSVFKLPLAAHKSLTESDPTRAYMSFQR